MRKRIPFDQCDEQEEVCGWLNKIRADQDQIEAKTIQNAQEIEALKKKKTKKKGSISMKPLVALVLLVLAFAGLCYATYVPTDITSEIAANHDLLAVYLRDCFGNITSNSYLFTPTTTAPSHSEGKVYYDNTLNKLQLSSGTDWLSIDTAGGVSLDSAYDYGSAGGGKAITASDGAVAISSTDADTAFLFTLNASPGSAAALGGAEVTVGSNSTEAAIEIENSGSGKDIEGTAGWTVDKAGAIVCVGLQSNAGGDVLFNDTYDISWDASADQLLFEDNAVLGIGGAHDGAADMTFKGDGTDVLLEVATEDAADLLIGSTNALDVKIHAATNTTYWLFNSDDTAGEMVFEGVDLMMMDDDIIVLGDSDDFQIYYEETTTDNLIVKTAAANDAVQIGDGTTGTDLKMMGATSGDYVNFDASADEMYHEDCDLKLNEGAQLEFCGSDNATDWTIDVATAERLTLTPSETDDTSVLHIGTADNTSDVVIYMKTAGETLTMDASADSLTFVGDLALFTLTGTTLPFHANVTGTVAGVAAQLETTDGGIKLLADGSANGDIDIDAEDKITIISTDTAQNGIHIEANGGTAESINLYANQGTGASATTEHDASIQLQSDAGGISLYTTGDVADAIRIETNGGVDEFITINNLKGTGTDAITITANAAGGDVDINSILGSIFIEAEEDSATAISIVSDGSTASGILIHNDTGTSVTEDTASIEILSDAGGICIQSDANLDDALVLRVDGGTTSEITIHNDRGNTADSIELISDAGGITLNGAVGGVVFTAGQTRHYVIRVNDIDLDGTNPPTLGSIGTDAQWRSDVLQFDSNPGGNDDVCYIQWHVPAGYVANSADLHCYWTHSDAEDAADECVIDGTVDACAAGETTDTAGTAMAAVTSVIADASASAGKLVKTSLDIEVEDIAVDDMVTIMFFFDESACLMATSGTADVHYFVITYESTE